MFSILYFDDEIKSILEQNCLVNEIILTSLKCLIGF
jgi:hypothetical protein